MPIVKIDIFEGRDEETKAIIGREVADVIAEHTINSLDDVHVIFEERARDNWSRGLKLASRRGTKASPDRVGYASVSRIKCEADREEEYIVLRRDVINPGMATQEGFVSSLFLRLIDSDGEYLLVNKWRSREDAQKYEKSELHEELRQKAMKVLPKPLETMGAEIVHLDR